MEPAKKLRVGILGAGEVAQAIHLPALVLLSHLFSVTAVCDVSAQTVAHVRARFQIADGTTSAAELIGHPDVDVVFNLTNDAFHAEYTVQALAAGKHVLLEKPAALSRAAVQAILAAEEAAGGEARVFVAYMRRYAPSFTRAFAREVRRIPRIRHVHVRDIVGPNAHFVAQSGTSPARFDDVPVAQRAVAAERYADELARALDEAGVPPAGDDAPRRFWSFLATLGSHDLSLMREVLGMPDSVAGVATCDPFYSAIFRYRNRNGAGEGFAAVYESGIDGVPRFDARLTVYGDTQTVSIIYDTPYIRGLPIKVRVEELVDGEAVTREILTSFEDAYTAELKEMHSCFTQGKPIKTSVKDALQDVEIWAMLVRKYHEDSKTLRQDLISVT